ncbi:HAMP domain-containing histidine kinase [Aciduricibacillus chroicocephali]|uniref:Signal transduction histidine-protein kinase ArlS n=1 Tax=Aciduricibacillus chroicocephali TaxID=3054939 RepID=A0ABY9KW58_9BACI|nr:HAMP domain-containing histidine kinase [Bacillaceae bacterium 44XB]
MSIKTRLGWLLVFWSLLILLAANAFTYIAFVNETEDRELDAIEDAGEGLLNMGIDLSDVNSKPFLKSLLPDDGMIRVLDNEGNVLVRVADEDDAAYFPPSRHLKKEKTAIVDIEGERIALFAVPVTNGGSATTLEISRNLSELQEEKRTLLLTMLSVSIVLLALAVLIGQFIAKRFLKPVSVIGRTMEDIKESGQFQRIVLSKRKDDELYALAMNFNHMIDSLEEIFARQERFIGDASHELKTPLTVIENYASILDRWGKKDPALLDEGIEAIRDESIRMKHLVEQLLDLASVQKQNFELDPIDVALLAKQTAQRLEKASGRNILMESGQGRTLAMTNKEKFVQILFILLDNALKYSEEAVTVKISANEETVIVEVKDKGIGIPQSEIPRLFERFYRVDASRTRATGGSGLGLAIARELTEKNGGNLQINSKQGEGTTVRLELPAVDERQS